MPPKTTAVPIRAAKLRDEAVDRMAEEMGLAGKTNGGVPLVRQGEAKLTNGKKNKHRKINTLAAPLQAPMPDLTQLGLDPRVAAEVRLANRAENGQRKSATKENWKRADRRKKERARRKADKARRKK